MDVQHEPHEVAPAPERRLCCAKCGHGFRVVDGERALERKRLLQAGHLEDPDAARKAFRAKAGELARVMQV